MIDPIGYLKRLVRNVPDFPKPGILFKDIMPLVFDLRARQYCLSLMEKLVSNIEHDQDMTFDVIVVIEARGIGFGTSLANQMGLPLVYARKPNKLPGEVVSQKYDLEYGTNKVMEMSVGFIKEGDRVLVVDDLLATGGSAKAVEGLLEQQGAVMAAALFIIELVDLNKLAGIPVLSVLKYGEEIDK